MKVTKKFFGIMLILVLTIFTACTSSAINSTVGSTSIANITFERVDISDVEDGRTYQSINYPIIHYDGEKEEIKRRIGEINNMFKDRAEFFKENSKENIRSYINDYLKNDENNDENNAADDAKFEFSVEPSVVRNDNKYISINSQLYEFTMGAHGNTTILCFNFDVENDKFLKFVDLIKDKEKTKAFICDALEKQYGDELFPEYKDTVAEYVDKDSNLQFTIDDKNLSIIFQQYDVAPYSTGIITVEIDKDLLNIEL